MASASHGASLDDQLKKFHAVLKAHKITHRIEQGRVWVKIFRSQSATGYKEWLVVDDKGNVRKRPNATSKVLFNLLTTPSKDWMTSIK